MSIFEDMSNLEIIKLLAPLIIIQFGLVVFTLFRLVKDRVKYLPKWGWALVIVFINLIGPIMYLIIGRERD
ncbi:Negative regulatory protein YxlE [bioreactor metagenome]|uniref:Negative regulatory protein YxlE n=1 Tax=bioreactor metagenome TaxID=1076179 RepID=A0A645E5U6_9ZZZZ